MFLRSTRIVALLSVALMSVPGLAAQGVRPTRAPVPEPGEGARAPDASAPLVLEGFVLEPSGAPAQGAVVVSSAGGKAVTDTLGRYRLEVRVPREAESVQVTAVSAAGRNRVASTRVELPTASRTTRVAPLLLTEGAACASRWLPTFGGTPGTNGFVHALAVYDDGGGAALYAGGSFTIAGGAPANYIAKWDGSSWSPLGSGTSGIVQALAAVHDDRAGAALYVGGTFGIAGGVAASHVAKWDGSSWTALGSGMNGSVRALTAYDDDGGGKALYAGGYFTTAGGVAASHIARWDGSSWSPLGSGMSSYVSALTVYDDGGGAALYAGGAFMTAGGVVANRIAKWDGSSWSALGGGFGSNFYHDVHALTVYDDGGGAALHAGGYFTKQGGAPVSFIAKWDGSSWSALGSAVNYTVHALAVYGDDGGTALFAGGQFGSHVARWDGSSWSELVRGMNRLNGSVSALAVYDDGGGAALYVGGSFRTAGGVAANHIARWDGSRWSALGSGTNGVVGALIVHEDEAGAALYAAGRFARAGRVATNNIAKWDGSRWSALGTGVGYFNNAVYAMAVYDDGGGAALYAGGFFQTAGGVAANHIAKWDGSRWSRVGSGIGSFPDAKVWSLAVYDDGGGPALYAGGFLQTAGGVSASNIAKWDGSIWSPLGSGVSGNFGPFIFPGVAAMAVYDDGGGEALYAGGRFSRAGGVAAAGIAKWDGSSWSPLPGSGSGYVSVLTVQQDDGGGALYVGGSFTTMGGVAASNIAKWDGSSWSPLGSGMNGAVSALAMLDDDRGAALYAGGGFSNAIDSRDAYLAKWACPAPLDGGPATSVTPVPQPGADGIRK